jgi:MFS transporter, FSR family, fosmidomycin resistance protein
MKRREPAPHLSTTPRADFKIIAALTLVHFTGDFYVSFVNPLLPAFVEKFSLSLTQVGLITGLSRLLAFVVQPSVGYLADHSRTRLFLLGGPLLTLLFIPALGIVPSYALLLVCVGLGSIGSSMYHPTAAGMISVYSGRQTGLSMSVFNLGGTLAFGLGPLVVGVFVARWGLPGLPFSALLGLIPMVYLFLTVPRPASEGLRDLGFIGSLRETLGETWKPILLIWIIGVLRSFLSQVFSTFVPILASNEGHSLVSVGVIVSLYNTGGALSGLLCGFLYDRMGYKTIFHVSNVLTALAFYLFLYLPGGWVYVSAFLAGFFVMAILPLTVAIGQELAPKGRSMISSLMMGLSYGLGGMMTPLAGTLSDLYSIRAALALIAPLPLLMIPLIALLPERPRR